MDNVTIGLILGAFVLGVLLEWMSQLIRLKRLGLFSIDGHLRSYAEIRTGVK